jgi:hypothetical protein
MSCCRPLVVDSTARPVYPSVHCQFCRVVQSVCLPTKRPLRLPLADRQTYRQTAVHHHWVCGAFFFFFFPTFLCIFIVVGTGVFVVCCPSCSRSPQTCATILYFCVSLVFFGPLLILSELSLSLLKLSLSSCNRHFESHTTITTTTKKKQRL